MAFTYLRLSDSTLRYDYLNLYGYSISARQVSFEIKEFRIVGGANIIEFNSDPALVLAAPFGAAKTFTVSGSTGGVNDGTFTIVSNVGPVYTVVEAVTAESHHEPTYPSALADDEVWRVVFERIAQSDASRNYNLVLDGTDWAKIVAAVEDSLTTYAIATDIDILRD